MATLELAYPRAARRRAPEISWVESSRSKSGRPLITVEAYLDQINTASGSGDTLADSYATDVKVPAGGSAPGS
jgi:hypothetical protein